MDIQSVILIIYLVTPVDSEITEKNAGSGEVDSYKLYKHQNQ